MRKDKGQIGYASSPQIKRAIKAVSASGIKLGSVELALDGSIRLVAAARATAEASNDAFADLEARGLV